MRRRRQEVNALHRAFAIEAWKDCCWSEVGLVDRSWCGRMPAVLTERLARILDSPDG